MCSQRIRYPVKPHGLTVRYPKRLYLEYTPTSVTEDSKSRRLPLIRMKRCLPTREEISKDLPKALKVLQALRGQVQLMSGAKCTRQYALRILLLTGCRPLRLTMMCFATSFSVRHIF